MTEGRAVALWLGCLLLMLGAAEEGHAFAMIGFALALVLATILIKGYKR